MEVRLGKLKAFTLAELIDQGSAFDPLAEAVYELESNMEKNCSLKNFMNFCCQCGLDLSRLNQALFDRAEQLHEQDRNEFAFLLK